MSTKANREYSVNWQHHMSHVRKAFDDLLNSNELTDVTLCCEGKKIAAHKMLLSACSSYFKDIFKDVPCQHPVIILYGVEYVVLADILHFIYNGQVSVDIGKLDLFLKTARQLQISGLTDDFSDPSHSDSEQTEAGASDQFVERNVASSTNNTNSEERQRGAKRQRFKETDMTREKLPKQENDMLFVTDVKCEPSELVNFTDPVEDPLQDQQDTGELFATSTAENSGEEEFKIERSYFESTTLLESDTKVKHSNFSEDCLKCPVCNKMFSHPYSLHHHKAVHSGNTQCPICHAVLSRKYNLKMHMKARHNL